jgi:hypothetical protein
MSVSIQIHNIVSAEAHTCNEDEPFSYVTVEDKKGSTVTFILSNGPMHEKRAAYLAEAFRIAILIKTEGKANEL